MIITTLIPTYCRPKDLERCLEALRDQARKPDEIIVVIRSTDHETLKYVERMRFGQEIMIRNQVTNGVKIALVDKEGVVAALNKGLSIAAGDIIAFTDDDAAPSSDWLEKIENHFLENPVLGALGGKDQMYFDGQAVMGESVIVGKILWYGKMVGSHHFGIGEPREVDILKGVNMSFRRKAMGSFRFDESMKGKGIQLEYEVDISLAIKENGWKVIYDPSVIVKHYLAERPDEDHRFGYDYKFIFNLSHNQTLVLLKHLFLIKPLISLIWAIFIGNRLVPGFVGFLFMIPRHKERAFKIYVACLNGRLEGIKTWVRNLRKQA